MCRGFTEEPEISQDIKGRGVEEITAGLFIEDHSILSFLAHSLVLAPPPLDTDSVSQQHQGHFLHFGEESVWLVTEYDSEGLCGPLILAGVEKQEPRRSDRDR